MTRKVNQSQCEGITQRMTGGTLDKSCAHVPTCSSSHRGEGETNHSEQSNRTEGGSRAQACTVQLASVMGQA